MREKIKLAFRKPNFQINDKKQRVRCVMKFTMRGDSKLMDELERFRNLTNDPIAGQVTADAIPSNGDEFSVEIGMKVARARAEKMAYRKVYNFLNRYLTFMGESGQLINEFKEKATSVIDHNEKYLAKF